MELKVVSMMIIFFVPEISCQCTFPTDIRGNWISADKGTITFTATTLTNYPLALSVSVTTMDFDCNTFTDGQYFLRGQTSFTTLGDTFRAHLCLEFYKLTTDKYYYYVATSIEQTINDRTYVVREPSTPVTHADACNRPKPYETGTYVMLVREGSTADSLAITCPTDILYVFDSVAMATPDGSSSCSGSKLNVCTDKSTLSYTYNGCTNTLTYSADGIWRCMYYKISGDVTYLAIWNTDASLVAGQTYRMACYALEWKGGTKLKTTSYPGSCRASQTSTSVVSPGVVMTLKDVSYDCDPKDGFDLVPFYVGAIALALLILGCFLVCLSYRHYKNAEKTSRVHHIRVKEKDDGPYKRESTSGIFSCNSTFFDDDEFNISTSTPNDYQQRKGKIIFKSERHRPSSPPTVSEILQPYYSKYKGHKRYNVYDDIHYAYTGKQVLQNQEVQTAEDFYRNQALLEHQLNIKKTKRKPTKRQVNRDYLNPKRRRENHPQRAKTLPKQHNKQLDRDNVYQNDLVNEPEVQLYKDRGVKNDSKGGTLPNKTDMGKTLPNKTDKGKTLPNKTDEGETLPYNIDKEEPLLYKTDNFIRFSDKHNIFADKSEAYNIKKDTSKQADGPNARGRGVVTNTVHYFDRRIPMHWK